MKKLLFSLSVASLFFFTSCEDDTSDIVMNITNNINNGNGGVVVPETEVEIGGVQTQDLTLDGTGENVTYLLTSPLIMEEGTTLTITAGTVIQSNAGTEGYIAVKQGATINAQGTECNPIVMTSSATTPSAGDWGGLVVLGHAPINAGAAAVSEVGQFAYGGSNAGDNSGIIRYVRLEYTGAAINAESEFNGFSFYGVGTGTTIENIEVFEGSDDGVEFFGGTANADNIVLVNCQDDSLDWTEGWNGTVNNVYIKMNDQGANAIEADGNESNNSAEPWSNPTINNITMIGASTGQEAVRFRRGTKATLNNVWVEGFAEGFDIDDAVTEQHVANGELSVNNVTFVDVDNQVVGNVSSADLFSGIGNGTMTDVDQWGYCWSTVGGGSTSRTIELAGVYTSDYTLNAVNNYKLSGTMIMEEGTTLTIPAGITVKCMAAGTQVYVAIKQGARIVAEGTASQPIVFTSSAASPQAGDWGGLVVLGNAPINAGAAAVSEVGQYAYGGTNAADDSGILKFVRLEYTGAAINAESEFNGFTFYGVGTGTVIENIQAYEGADDGVEFFGGTANAKNVALVNNQDDSLDWTEGWNGTIENVYIKMNENGANAIEADGNESNNHAEPFSSPTITNITAIGVGGQEAFRIRRGTQVNMTNVYLQNFDEGFDVDNPLTVDWIQQGVSNVTNVTFDNVTTHLVSDNGTNGNPATEDDFFSGIGNGTMLDVSGWSWAIEL